MLADNALKFSDISKDVAAVGYALTMLPKWIGMLADGSMTPEGVVRACRQDLTSAGPAFERLRVKLYEIEG